MFVLNRKRISFNGTGKVVNRQNGKLMKWQVDKMAS
jgi:hypothetical protein